METYRGKIRDLEKSIEKRVEVLENNLENPDEQVSLVGINKDFEEFKENLDKIKGMDISKHEQAYIKQYSSSFFRLKQRFTSISSAIEGKRLKKELIGTGNDTNSTQIDILLTESRNLDNSLELTHQVLNAAQEVKASLAYQKGKVTATSDKIVRFAETLPGISTLIGKISRRKRFNAIVIGLTLFVCILITLLYLS